MYVCPCLYVHSGKEEQSWLITGVKINVIIWKKQCLTVYDVATFHFKVHLEVFGYVMTSTSEFDKIVIIKSRLAFTNI